MGRSRPGPRRASGLRSAARTVVVGACSVTSGRGRGDVPRAHLASCCGYVPERVLGNEELAREIDTSDEWIVERTGIRERRIAGSEERSSDMAAAASTRALAAARLAPSELALIVVATISPDQPLPSTAVHLQRKLGARCPAFDLAAGCAGFLYGLELARRFVETGDGPVLVVGVELLSRLLDWKDRETCVLFGDGAGAAVVAPATGSVQGILASVLHADGRHAGLLQIPVDEGVVRMQGPEVFRLAVTELAASTTEVLELAGIRPEQVDLVVAHQANRRILEAVSRRCGIPWERFHVTIDRYGNTSSASIPLGLADALEAGRVGAGDLVLMAALGAGAAWGATVARL